MMTQLSVIIREVLGLLSLIPESHPLSAELILVRFSIWVVLK